MTRMYHALLPAVSCYTTPALRLGEVLAPTLLREAWKRVRANRGAPGGDGVTIEEFSTGLDRRLNRLANAITSGVYRPGPLRRCRMSKPSGGFRELAIPCVGDRVVQTAMLIALTPTLDSRMTPGSFAYRPGRSVTQALELARSLIGQGRDWVLDADIRRFFDSIPHVRLLEELTIWIDDQRLFSLAALWVRSAGGRCGLPQGSPISPLFANLYLHPVDKLLAAAGISAVRYADDFVCLCESYEAAKRALDIAKGALAARGLELNSEKTLITDVPSRVIFLGERLWPIEGNHKSPAAIRSSTRLL